MFGGTGALGSFTFCTAGNGRGDGAAGTGCLHPNKFSARRKFSVKTVCPGPSPRRFGLGKVAHQLEGKRWFSTASDGNEATGRPQKTMLNATQAGCLIPL